MTNDELAEFRELAGLNEPQTTTEMQKEWADKQLTNQPKIENPAPVPTPEQFGNPTLKGQTYGGNSGVQQEADNIANRLNGLLITPGKSPQQPEITNKIENDKELEGLANRLNKSLGHFALDVKIERLQ